MKKIFVSLTEPQLAHLEAEAKRLGVRVPELLRRIVDEHRKEKS